MIKMLYNRCTGIYKFGNKYLPSAYKTQFEFRSHFSGGKVRLIGREIRYMTSAPTMFCVRVSVWETFIKIYKEHLNLDYI
jgi:hypothetical protein